MSKVYNNGGIVEPASLESVQDILIELQVLPTEIVKMGTLLTTIAAAQTSMAQSALSMAQSIERGETRYEKLEDRLQGVNDRAAGKGQIPLTSHLAILFSTVLVTVLVVLYVHRQSIDASLTSISVKPAGTP